MKMFLATILITVLGIFPVQASICVATTSVNVLQDTVKKTYKEVLLLRGKQRDMLIELYGNLATGSWSVITIGPVATCLILSGKELNVPAPEIIGKDL